MKGRWLAAGGPAVKGFLANAVKGDVVLSWEPADGADGYEVYERREEGGAWRLAKVVRGRRLLLPGKRAGSRYAYRIRAYRVARESQVFGRFSRPLSVTVPREGKTTLRNLLQIALAPIGAAMYVWGGGWDAADFGAGKEARSIGLSPDWRRFAARQTPRYDWKKTKDQRGDGLDCSGYIGWCLYNAFHTKDGRAGEGYVCPAAKQAAALAGLGWGSCRPAAEVTDHRAGDVMSGPGHVYLVIGECADGSVVLVHASPAGVQLGGTATPAGNRRSEAARLAAAYMARYRFGWFLRYPRAARDVSYLTDYGQFRWDLTGRGVLTDPDGCREKPPGKLLRDLLGKKEKRVYIFCKI